MAFGLAPPAPRRSRSDFVVTASNAYALSTLSQWLCSDHPLLAVVGPAASGKTHVLAIIAEEKGASAGSSRVEIHDNIDKNYTALEILSRIERARERGQRLAIAGRGAPLEWARGLRDLETRLSTAARIDLSEPDDTLIEAIVLKLLRDRQLRAGRGLAAYAAARLPRTFAAAQAFVDALDAQSLAEGAPAGLRIAKNVIANLSEEPPAS
ncbi:MAG: hypothetical protein U5J99_03990 [Parvularculaceae bacterium]|nr:hypothetical protein [Parvularculaceae bacterium]